MPEINDKDVSKSALAEAAAKAAEAKKNEQGQRQGIQDKPVEEKKVEEEAARRFAAEKKAEEETTKRLAEEARQADEKLKAEENLRKSFDEKNRERESLAAAANSQKAYDALMQNKVRDLTPEPVVDTAVPAGRSGTFIVPDSDRYVGPVRYFKSSFPTFNFDVQFSMALEEPVRRGFVVPTKNFGKHRFVGGWFVTNHDGVARYITEEFMGRTGIPMRVEEGSAEEYQRSRQLGTMDAGIIQPVIEPFPSDRSPLAGGFHTGATSSRGNVVKG